MRSREGKLSRQPEEDEREKEGARERDSTQRKRVAPVRAGGARYSPSPGEATNKPQHEKAHIEYDTALQDRSRCRDDIYLSFPGRSSLRKEKPWITVRSTAEETCVCGIRCLYLEDESRKPRSYPYVLALHLP